MAISINGNNAAPWYLEPNDCLGDSLGYINQNAAYTTTLAASASLNTLTTNVNTLSSNVYNYRELTTNTVTTSTTVFGNIFPTGDLLAANATYEVIYDIYGSTTGTTGTAALTFRILGNSSNIASANLFMTHVTNITAPTPAIFTQGRINTATTNEVNPGQSFGASIKNAPTYTQARLYIKTAGSVTINVQANCAAVNTTYTALKNSYRKLTRVY
jgi:hypothetical protein